ncbi:helix-turn-helix transcriptional regulator [Labilibaculum antarcticum]|uniref:AraC family transcriptional regulator n=1 Tax=Labilibaculum antarcticum TaxID=1717717 RepID=A0A1Y1CMM5_9BACT|nr:helix-turn-helix transcriptional regulator [Labilibaculum antarcticum]BAX81212.1 AraC family transcriptional regulator [Labilibaculum antarcticum]
MISPGLINEIKIQIYNTAKCTVGQEWNYSNIISPFSRIYLITEGEGYILPDHNMLKLKPGYLYLVPGYTLCGYHCVESLSQYYLHFSHQMSDGLKIFDQIPVTHQVEALPIDIHLFKRLLEINPTLGLKHSDPNVYEKSSWKRNPMDHRSNTIQLETEGIIKQLFSRFIRSGNTETLHLQKQSFIKKSFEFISNHLYEEIRLESLASLACCSTDHFTRQFKSITGMRPMEFINRKRVEKAQELLITTTKSQKNISEEIGFNSQQYYTRIFKKITNSTPEEYRKMGGLI